ncbi:MAG: prepilin-type N-terminal cleavage/methylation domain-containing protein [Phycisphaeraceae bacterium]|nr:prepilin-type N-terminal cleavage/methylation domain-containing protein [Phycisphaeraceae bacterium]
MRRLAFTLIELLVVIAIIALLIGIAVPALSGARESSRRVKCMVNLSGIGKGLQMYMDTKSKGLLPFASGLIESTDRPTFPEVVGEFLDTPKPVKEADGFYRSNEPWKCPSDIIGTDEATNLEPTYRVGGSSYEYWPGSIMLLADFIKLELTRPEFSLTKLYQRQRNDPNTQQSKYWPVLACADQWHKLRAASLDRRNALYLDNGMRVDWCIPRPAGAEITELILELAKEPNNLFK